MPVTIIRSNIHQFFPFQHKHFSQSPELKEWYCMLASNTPTDTPCIPMLIKFEYATAMKIILFCDR